MAGLIYGAAGTMHGMSGMINGGPALKYGAGPIVLNFLTDLSTDLSTIGFGQRTRSEVRRLAGMMYGELDN